jgi:hypothetical protein
MFHNNVSLVPYKSSMYNSHVWMNDAYAHVMQVQWCKDNTWGVTGCPDQLGPWWPAHVCYGSVDATAWCPWSTGCKTSSFPVDGYRLNAAQCLVAWEQVCRTKEDGGLGIKWLDTQNASLLLKLINRLHHSEGSAWVTLKHATQEYIKGSFRSFYFRGIRIYLLTIWFGIWHSTTFLNSHINISQIHRMGDKNWFYISSCYIFTLQLIACSSTRFPTVEI